MGKILVFTVTVVFCLGVCVVTAKETGKNDVLLSESEIKDYISVDKSVNKVFRNNGSELEAARPDECECKNGKCMRVCDLEKIIPCLNKRKVCTCIPGYAELDGECIDCNCGKGFNCKFKQVNSDLWEKTCLCPKGYRVFLALDSYDDYCKPECSNKQPCQNGGTCFNKECKCPWATRGALCEEISHCSSRCENLLEMDCNYNQPMELAYCTCKNSSLYYDKEENICKPCPCGNGYCKYVFDSFNQYLRCTCHPGYQDINGYCKQCNCGNGGRCQFNSEGKKTCRCPAGFYEREGRCHICGCMHPSDMDTECDVIANVKRCFCRKEGYHDVLGQCEDIDECEMYHPCHSSTTCHNTDGGFECRCLEGYTGPTGSTVKPGEVCEDINECKKIPNPCYGWNDVKCVNLPGTYKCECYEGYEPSRFKIEPQNTICYPTTKSWGPALIVLFTSGALIVVLVIVHICLKKRAARSN